MASIDHDPARCAPPRREPISIRPLSNAASVPPPRDAKVLRRGQRAGDLQLRAAGQRQVVGADRVGPGRSRQVAPLSTTSDEKPVNR